MKGFGDLWCKPRKRSNPLEFTVSPQGCYLLNRSPSQRYVVFRWRGEDLLAHRHIWEECFGEIPKGMCVCHKCDTPKCINPEHLFLGSHTDNMQDKCQKGRQAAGDTNGRSKLSSTKVEFIRANYKPYDATYGRRALSHLFGVDESTVDDAINYRNWR